MFLEEIKNAVQKDVMQSVQHVLTRHENITSESHRRLRETMNIHRMQVSTLIKTHGQQPAATRVASSPGVSNPHGSPGGTSIDSNDAKLLRQMEIMDQSISDASINSKLHYNEPHVRNLLKSFHLPAATAAEPQAECVDLVSPIDKGTPTVNRTPPSPKGQRVVTRSASALKKQSLASKGEKVSIISHLVFHPSSPYFIPFI